MEDTFWKKLVTKLLLSLTSLKDKQLKKQVVKNTRHFFEIDFSNANELRS